jgi:hypothetical protein
LTQVLVEQHAENECEWVAADELVGREVLGDGRPSHAGGLPYGHGDLADLPFRAEGWRTVRRRPRDRSTRP